MSQTTHRLPSRAATDHMDGFVGIPQDNLVGFPLGLSSKPLDVPKPPFQGCLGDYHILQYDYNNKDYVAVDPYAFSNASTCRWICCDAPVPSAE